MASSDFDTIRTMSEGSLSSEDTEINFSGSSSSSSAQELEDNTIWSPMVPASTPPPQSPSESGTVCHIAVQDYSSPQIDHINSPAHCHVSAKMDYLLFLLRVGSDPELCNTGGAEMVQLSDVFDVHEQTKARPVIIATASLGYVRGTIFPASTLLQKPGSRNFQTLFCIESDFPMPKGTSGSAVFDAQTGLLAGYLVLGCPGKHTCYMVPISDALVELSTLTGSTVQCQVQLNVSVIVEMPPDNSALMRSSFHAGGLNPLKFAAFGGYVKRLTTATLEWVSEPDEWKKRFTNNKKISPEVENQSFGDVLRASELDFDEIEWLMRPSTSAARCERRVLHVKRFCAGAEFRLHDAVPADPGILELVGAQEPEAWVSDRNWVDETLVDPPPNYPLMLDNNELYQVLQKKRFPPGSQGDIVGPPRRIYIKNPNGTSVVAMIKTTPASQVEGFRNLFADYITPTPEPKFRLRESTWWSGCFIISFNIPYYGITTREQQDCRTISNGGKRFRNRYDLDFLHLEGYGISEGESPSYHDDAVLHQLVFSLTVTGKSDKYWTAACLDDDVFGEDLGEEPRLASDAELEGMSDPILLKAEGDLTLSPRAYAIAALEVALSKIVENHANVLDWFRASLSRHTSGAEGGFLAKILPKELQNWIEKFPEAVNNVAHSTSNLVRKLDHFLKEDVMIGPNAQPQGVLWQSLQSDPDALRSLQIIKQYRDDLFDIEGELEQLDNACEGVRRKVMLKQKGLGPRSLLGLIFQQASHSRPFDRSKLTPGAEKKRQ
ncbi:hypothetical protein LCI18_008233 [Fusarium solani-melongenae]|uniref:Uncharacterized protein n=1 Tax=Fusarium solani subsp. cucurbitae TaxID=2747967 RepID=A0ACD3Z7R0_FUSSC|nr:hypothetical protein LCI18_008233 [Fusarium solani-melongenae]